MRRSWAVLAVLALVTVTMYTAVRAHRDLTDFEAYRTAAIRAAHAEPLYRPTDGHYQFKYLPAFAVVTRPITWLPAETAKLIWFALSFGMLAWFVRTLVVKLPDRRLTALALGSWTVVVMGKFFIRELALGQTNALLALLLVPSIVALARSPRRAAFGAGAAVFVKPYALLLLPWLAWREPRRAVAVVAAAALLGLLLPVVVYGWSGNLHLLGDWLRTVEDTTSPNLLHPDNVSLASLWAKWLGIGPMASALAIATAGMAVAAVGWVCAARPGQPGAAYLEGGLLLLLIPLLSPQGWDYVLLLGTPVVVAVIDRWRALSTPTRLVAAGVGIVFATPLRLFVSVDTYNAVMASGIVSVAALALVALAVGLRARSLA